MSTLHDVFRSDATQLAGLINLDANAPGNWRPEELGEVWRYQLDAPLEFDLTEQMQEAGTTYAAASLAMYDPPKTFRELLAHPQPSRQLLVLAKDFSKKQSQGGDAALPREIALALYFVVISVALNRRGERITGLAEAKLRAGIEWAIAQPWLDESTRMLFGEGLKQIPT